MNGGGLGPGDGPVILSGPGFTRVDLQLRFGDTDALGHVNNAVYASYAELGRIDHLQKLGVPIGNFILARLAMDYRRQVLLEERCHIETGVLRVGRSSITMRQLMYAEGQLACEMEAVIVWFDYETNRPVAVPDGAREVLVAIGDT